MKLTLSKARVRLWSTLVGRGIVCQYQLNVSGDEVMVKCFKRILPGKDHGHCQNCYVDVKCRIALWRLCIELVNCYNTNQDSLEETLYCPAALQRLCIVL